MTGVTVEALCLPPIHLSLTLIALAAVAHDTEPQNTRKKEILVGEVLPKTTNLLSYSGPQFYPCSCSSDLAMERGKRDNRVYDTRNRMSRAPCLSGRPPQPHRSPPLPSRFCLSLLTHRHSISFRISFFFRATPLFSIFGAFQVTCVQQNSHEGFERWFVVL
jgi:hypothetical protein